jgi:hypothetical protein
MAIREELSVPIQQLLTKLVGRPSIDALIDAKPLSGGREASEILLVTARYRAGTSRLRMLRFIAKRLEGRPAREAAIYESLVASHAGELAPQLLAVERPGADAAILFIEAIRRTSSWPWRNPRAGEDLLTRLARFHALAEGATTAIPEWDYEMELSTIAERTRTVLEQCRYDPDLSPLTRNLRTLDGMILALPRFRSQLLREHPFGCRPIHGDVHPGNALVRRRNGGEEPVLLDWGRARLGSPLEDVSSWLQSLGYWEPQGRRYHDTLLMTYLTALGMERKLTSSIRAAYWLAGASSVLSGALLHHLCIAKDHRESPSRRAAAFHAAQDSLRVIRRARAWWQS